LRKTAVILLLFVVSIPAWSNNYCRDVFNRLVNSVSNVYGTKPTLTIVESNYLVAETYNTGEVKVGSRLIELCRRFGKDSTNAIAHVLSHELAHYYQNHAWISNFTSAYANVEWSRKLTESEQQLLPVYETQADEMGFFYALNAGYQSWKVSGAVLDSIYKWYELPKELPGYPPLEQRKKISAGAKEKVAALMPLFRIANYFTIMGKYFPGETQYVFYESAGYCLDHLVHENIKTPNVLNNLGVIYFLQAQPYFYAPINKIMYPLVIDDNASAMDMSEMVGTKGQTPDTRELAAEAIELLEKAKDAFTQALKTNKNYMPANINITMVYFLLNEEGALADKLKFIQTLVKDHESYLAIAYQVEAFGYYLKGDTKKMTEAFKKAIKLKDHIAQWNYEVLTKTKSNTNETLAGIQWPVDTNEKIFGKNVAAFFKGYRSPQETRLDPYHQKFIFWTDKKTEGTIYMFRSLFAQTVYRDMIFFEVENENFETTAGLKLGMQQDNVQKIYGNPYFKNVSASTDQYLYPSQSMIITVNHDSKIVTGIMYYGMKK
jgi:tetratricopeptide (TPR) repeat protein